MPYDISATGFTAIVQADKTFPQGFQLSAWADDADPFDLPAAAIAETAMDVNGNLVSWSAPQPQAITLNVIPGSEEDNNLRVLLEANTAKRGRRAAGDLITIVASYGDGSILTARNGKITQGPRGVSVANAGRHKSNEYTFVFQDFDFVRA
jgi:hypothetical protein